MKALSVGRIDEGKGVPELLRAWEQIVRDFPTAHLEVAGEGSLRSRMISETSNRGLDRHIRFPGFLNDDEIVKLQSESRFFITLSRTEGFGMAIAEALAAGLPVVAWDIPPLREIFGDCEAVFLCPQGNVKQVVSSSANLLTIPQENWNELSTQASNYSHRFSWREAARKELNVFERAREDLQSSN
jgi:glycosyltransferase involved in cell wall biosynthesis